MKYLILVFVLLFPNVADANNVQFWTKNSTEIRLSDHFKLKGENEFRLKKFSDLDPYRHSVDVGFFFQEPWLNLFAATAYLKGVYRDGESFEYRPYLDFGVKYKFIERLEIYSRNRAEARIQNIVKFVVRNKTGLKLRLLEDFIFNIDGEPYFVINGLERVRFTASLKWKAFTLYHMRQIKVENLQTMLVVGFNTKISF